VAPKSRATLTADIREQASGVPSLLGQMPSIHLVSGTLPCGRALYILQGLPGIGPRRARALLDQFGSVAAVVTADASALAEIAGIGDAVARSIHEALGEERSSDRATVVWRPSSRI
jgi:DNA integrity scanning protein DisA with diadenylate cyclase activity